MNDKDKELLHQMTNLKIERDKRNSRFFAEKRRLRSRFTDIWPKDTTGGLYVTPEPGDDVVALVMPVVSRDLFTLDEPRGKSTTKFAVRGDKVLGFCRVSHAQVTRTI